MLHIQLWKEKIKIFGFIERRLFLMFVLNNFKSSLFKKKLQLTNEFSCICGRGWRCRRTQTTNFENCLLNYISTYVKNLFIPKSIVNFNFSTIFDNYHNNILQVEPSAERCVSTLLELIQTKVNYVVQEAIVVIKDIFRKYPNKYESIISTLCENLDTLDEPEARASMVGKIIIKLKIKSKKKTSQK